MAERTKTGKTGNPSREAVAVSGPASTDRHRTWIHNETLQAALVLALLLNIFFFPFIWGDKTLLLSARGAPSIMQSGAAGPAPPLRLGRTPDAGGAAWYFEPLVQVIGHEYLHEKTLPLWNAYAGYGTPLAAAMQPQAFHPLTVLLSFHPTPTTFALFFLLRLWIAGFFTYLFLKLFVEHPGALAAAIAFMFTGYFMLFLNAFHLTVEMMIPALFFAFELLHRRFEARIIVLSSAVILLTILGGAPESTFLAVTFACSYYLLRFVTDPRTITSTRQQIGRLTLVNLLGFGMGAIILAPFQEFVRHSFNIHSGAELRGIEIAITPRTLLAYLAPLVQGPPGPSLFGGPNMVEGYCGMTAGLLAMVAIVGWVADRRSSKSDASVLLVPFFTISAAAMMMKRCGLPVVQWIGYLPLFRMVVLYKYLEPLIGFSLAVLCGLGVARVASRRCRPAHVAAATALVLAGFLAGYIAFLPHVIALKQDGPIFFESTTAALLVLLVVTTILAVGAAWEFVPRGRFRIVPPTGVLLQACLAGELLLIFIYPLYYKYSPQPDKSANPFSGSPYISWLKQRTSNASRVFAREGLLYPNWSGVFGLFDIRDLDAIYTQRYLYFVRAFFPLDAVDHDLYDRFTGASPYYAFLTPGSRRLLQLSSVRYLVTPTPFAADSLISQFLEAYPKTKTPGEIPLAETDWTIAGVTKHVLFQHPPSSPKAIEVPIGPGRSELSFSLGMEPKGYGGVCGDGVDFNVDVRDAGGALKRVFHGFINPYGNPADRHWFNEKVDLSGYNGQTVGILLSTDPGPKGDNCMDWAGWGDPQLGRSPFNLVYDNEVKIYEYPSVLPRAAIYYGVETRATDQQALDRLLDPAFNIFQRAVITSSGLSPAIVRKIDEINTAPVRQAAAGRIVRIESREVDIDATLDRAGILVLNDTDYPGWHADVDGKEVPILTTNYLFRGVLLEGGRHRVRFRYEPASFHIGIAVSLLAVLGLVLTVRFQDRLHLS